MMRSRYWILLYRPTDVQISIVRQAAAHKGSLRGILAQKPLGANFAEAAEIVRLCREAGIVLAGNQNMRYDQSIRAFRFWFGDPDRISASLRPDPRTRFEHTDGVCFYVLEYDESSLRASAWDDVWTGPAREGAGEDIAIGWRVEGTEGLAQLARAHTEHPGLHHDPG